MRLLHGSILRILARAAQHLLGCHVMNEGWNCYFSLPEQVILEFNLMKDILYTYNGQFIPTCHTGGSVERESILKYCNLVSSTDVYVPNLII